MNVRISFLKLAAVVSVASAALAPATAHAQTNRGQVVQAVVKLNNAQLTLAKKLAEDPQFAAQFDKATSSGNYDAAASLAASATGFPKSGIRVSPSAPGGDDSHEAATTTSAKSVNQLASFSPSKERKFTSGKICFWTLLVEGCISW